MEVKKKIAIVCFSHSLGGLELSALRLTEAMSKRETSILLIASPFSPIAERAQKANLDLVTLSPRWKYGDVSTFIALVRILKSRHIDIVMLMQSKDIHLAAAASMFIPHLKLVYYQQMNSRHNKRDIIHTWIYSRLALWISLTQSMKNDVLAFTRMHRDKVKVVTLGTDLHQFNPSHFRSTKIFWTASGKENCRSIRPPRQTQRAGYFPSCCTRSDEAASECSFSCCRRRNCRRARL
jgi:hypothetical protein